MSKPKNITTKVLPIEEEKDYILHNAAFVQHPKYKEKENKEIAIEKLLLFNLVNRFNFIKSKVGEIYFSTKLDVDNFIKSHCLVKCYTHSETTSIHQSEKLCLLNCLSESESLFEGFKAYRHQKAQLSENNHDFQLSSTIPIKRLI